MLLLVAAEHPGMRQQAGHKAHELRGLAVVAGKARQKGANRPRGALALAGRTVSRSYPMEIWVRHSTTYAERNGLWRRDPDLWVAAILCTIARFRRFSRAFPPWCIAGPQLKTGLCRAGSLQRQICVSDLCWKIYALLLLVPVI